MDDLTLLQEHWAEILEKVRRDHELMDLSFNTWLVPLRIQSVKDGVVMLLVSLGGSVGVNYLRKNFSIPLRIAIGEICGLSYDVQFISSEEVDAGEELRAQTESAILRANLNPRYTFDTFVVGSNNQFAHAAAVAVAESPGEVYNPLYLYSGVGLGKTHLMHSICRYIAEHDPTKKVLYVPSELFTNELINSLRNRNDQSIVKFREKYRNIDVLAIDDIQFIIGKESTQEEFFHTFNTLYGAKKQLIVSSDKPPRDLDILEERIKSRLEMGLIADISVPDYETRMAILRRLEEQKGYVIDDAVRDYIAKNIKSNIRTLESCINKIIAKSDFSHIHVNIDMAKEILQDVITPDKGRRLTAEDIIGAVCEHFQMTPEELKSSKRNTEYVYPRKIAMYLCRSMTDMPLQSIASNLGRKDHTTVMNACQSIEREMEVSTDTARDVDILKKKISESA